MTPLNCHAKSDPCRTRNSHALCLRKSTTDPPPHRHKGPTSCLSRTAHRPASLICTHFPSVSLICTHFPSALFGPFRGRYSRSGHAEYQLTRSSRNKAKHFDPHWSPHQYGREDQLSLMVAGHQYLTQPTRNSREMVWGLSNERAVSVTDRVHCCSSRSLKSALCARATLSRLLMT